MTKSSKNLSYYTASFWILRGMAAIYLVAFAAAYYQNEGLFGNYGLIPKVYEQWNDKKFTDWDSFVRQPSLLWFLPSVLDTETWMKYIYMIGMALSMVVMVIPRDSWMIQSLLWAAYLTIVTVTSGSSFYAYGWESQIIETGFLCIFLCDLPSIRTGTISLALWQRRQDSPSPIVLWLFRWLSFRISIGAGLIKVRGSSCWQDRTCLHHHFETQPIPSPLSFYYHFLPSAVQSLMIEVDFVVQLYTAWFVLVLPWRWPLRLVLRTGGWMQSLFMVGIALSGNFSVLNHLTILPALACLDDDAGWPRMLTARTPNPSRANSFTLTRRLLVDIPLLLYILYLSRPVVDNLLQLQGSRQVMNQSFDTFRLVNTYGAFGSVGTERYEAIVQISDDNGEWIELEFPCKPGNLRRRPCFCAPYHYRLDWNIWFLGFKPHQAYLRQRESWLYIFIIKLLQDSEQRPWLDLLDSSSAQLLQERYFDKGSLPRFAKVDMFRYTMTESLQGIAWKMIHGEDVVWWSRNFEDSLIPVVRLDDSSGRLQLVT